MIEVLINGKTQQVALNVSLEPLVTQFAGVGPFAVALNGQFVSKDKYAEIQIVADDRIDILSPIQGG